MRQKFMNETNKATANVIVEGVIQDLSQNIKDQEIENILVRKYL